MRYGNIKITALRRFLVVLLFVGAGCAPDSPKEPITAEPTFRPDGILDFIRPDSSIISRIVIEIAENDAAHAAGLMYRRSLAEQAGMLFVFPRSEPKSFWMKNTPLSLDIIFLDEEGTILNIVKRTKPFSEEFIESVAPAKYVVEVRAGYADKHGLAVSQKIKWERRTFN